MKKTRERDGERREADLGVIGLAERGTRMGGELGGASGGREGSRLGSRRHGRFGNQRYDCGGCGRLGDAWRQTCDEERAKIRDQMPEIRGQRGSSGQCASASVDEAALYRHQRATAGNSGSPESRCEFVLQDADGEVLMRRECPEMVWGKAKD
jgi:hypothetical protein